MFDQIAPRYDFLNHFLSLGIDRMWRKKAIAVLKKYKPKTILDVATGTGDLALEAMRQLDADSITGIDISEQMLQVGRRKIEKSGLHSKIEMKQADSENLPFAATSFDAVTVAFGVRNFEHLDRGLAEIYRVMKPGAALVILEFSKPRTFPYKQVYQFYFRYVLPFWGNLISKSSNAYTYLPQSVNHFAEGEEFAGYLCNCGFKNILVKTLTFGTCSLYTAEK